VGAQGFASAGVTLPLFDRNQGNVAAAEADLERARNEVTRAQLAARQTLEPVAQNYRLHLAEATRYRNDLLPRAEKAYQLYLGKYRQMALPYPQVIVSQRTLFQLHLTYMEILRGVWQEAVALRNFGLTGALDAAMRP
jgi:outer membrane protein, heavy metal efflux system